MSNDDPVLQALIALDEAVDALGRPIWIGTEPTFTDPVSEKPEWLFEALGDDKRKRAEHMLETLARSAPGGAVLRCVGRQYSEEPVPRWSQGIYARRDGEPVWSGPPDPLLAEHISKAPEPMALAESLARILESNDLPAISLDVGGSSPARVAFRESEDLPADPDSEPLLARPSIHTDKVTGVEPVDALAATGTYLVAIGRHDDGLHVELPAIADVDLYLHVLGYLGEAATLVGAPSLLMAGYPPPVDDRVAWTTLTPDPAVIEVNTAPVTGVADLLRELAKLYETAKAEGLSPVRLQYNGVESDSGGGGQITLGGPRPETSPFLTVPTLLPSLVRYFNHHPSLSYLHAGQSAGSASQAPRADECLRESFLELNLTLELLKRSEAPSPDKLWKALTPFLSDPSGNRHRAEINIEKLWNPFLGGRGRLGLVEFRAFRMGATPQVAAAVAALLRAITAMLADKPLKAPLIDWGDTLHQRFSLPFYLQRDMQEVFSDLEQAGLPFGQPLRNALLDNERLVLSRLDLGDCRLEIRRALEFWPLVGDVASQESGGSRLVDSSSSRIEIRLRGSERSDALEDWTMAVANWEVPLRSERDPGGPVRVAGIRYRAFVPTSGLHPTLSAQSPLTLTLAHPRHGAWRIRLHEWHPDNKPYPGLPTDLKDARARRAQRCILEPMDTAAPPPEKPSVAAVGDCVLDLRWLDLA